MTEARNPDFPYDGDEDSLVQAVPVMDLASRELLSASAGFADNDHGGAQSPVQSSKPGSDTAETASIPAPTVEDETDSSSEAGNRDSDNGSSTHARPSAQTPAYWEVLENLRSTAAGSPSANCSACKHDQLVSSLIHRLQHTEPEATCRAHPNHLPIYRLRSSDAMAPRQGPGPKMRVRAERTGDRDFTLRVHWDDEETGEAIATPANSHPAVTRAPHADLGRLRNDLDDAPAQLIERPHNNMEPVQKTETKAQEEEEVNLHALPEIHHQQQHSAASAAPAAGSQARAIEPGSLLNHAVTHGHGFSGNLPPPHGRDGSVFIFPPPPCPMWERARPYQQPVAGRGYIPQYSSQYMSNEPYLVVNPPVVPPAVQATVPGTASWPHPNYRQTSFHTGTAHWRTNPPIIVGQPGPQQPTIVNGQTHNIIFYR